MGRKSRAKRDRRAAGQRHPALHRREISSGRWLDERGRQLGMNLSQFGASARLEGSTRIRQRLLANHNERMVACGRLPADYLVECWRPMRYNHFLYWGLQHIAADRNRHPSDYTGSWPDHLRFGVDSIHQSVRFLLAGQMIPAAIIARGQLERWTENRGFSLGLKRQDDESSLEYVERVWTFRPLAAFKREPLRSSVEVHGRRIEPRATMRKLLALIHGESFTEASMWGNERFQGLPPDAVGAAALISDALLLSFHQLSACIANWLEEECNEKRLADTVRHMRPPNPDYGVQIPPQLIWPANLLLLQTQNAEVVHRLGATYEAVLRGERPEGRLYHDGEMAVLCFAHYRSRCLSFAATGYARETELYGPRTHDHQLPYELPPVLTSEIAAALSSWLPADSPQRAAAAAVSDGLRGAYWLWLEDDQRAMGALRVVLEQISRLRVWRLKPQQAEKLEDNANVTRWLEKAGWRRLAPLNRALGEMSHFHGKVHWGAAFELLVQLNIGEAVDEAPHTARRHALQVVTRLASRELRDQVRNLDASVATALDAIAAEIFAGGPTVDRRLDEYLDHAHSLRSHSFPAASEWHGPAHVEEVGSEGEVDGPGNSTPQPAD